MRKQRSVAAPDAADSVWHRPTPEQVRRVHDRYLVEVVENLGLCPFARRSRELGRVHRPILWNDDGDGPSAGDASAALAACVNAHPDAEIVLLTFVVPDDHRLSSADTFEQFVYDVRESCAAGVHPRFYVVGFHPGFGSYADAETTADNLVPLLRRTPDPVIQCVRADMLDDVRRQAQKQARSRIERDLAHRDPRLLVLLRNSIQADPELSADIARHNFGTVGSGEGRHRLEALIADIRRDRDVSYGRHEP